MTFLKSKKKGKEIFALLSLTAALTLTQTTMVNASPIAPSIEIKTPSQSALHYIAEDSLQGSQDFVSSLARTGISFLSNPDLSETGKKKQFRALLERNFDLEKIGRVALGPYWRNATPAQQTEYQKVFKDMIIEVYSNRFKNYQNQTVDVNSATQKGKNILVSSAIKDENGPDIKLDWVVRQKGNTYKVIDVMVEGVSMVITQRSDFAAVIQKNGGDIQALIDSLKLKKAE